MPCACGRYCDTADEQFSRQRADKELRRYRRRGPGKTTRLLRDSLAAAAVPDASLLDVGAGIASLTFEMLDRGVTRATVVDASPSYIAAGRDEAARRGSTAVRFVHADFVETGEPLPRASIVALDRVVCCYPSYRSLLERATRHAERVLALSYPRDRWFVRAGFWLDNAMRTSGFRTFIHPVDAMTRVIESAGFTRVSQRVTAVWSIDVFMRERA